MDVNVINETDLNEIPDWQTLRRGILRWPLWNSSCPGCSERVTFFDPDYPYCAKCGASLIWPNEERI